MVYKNLSHGEIFIYTKLPVIFPVCVRYGLYQHLVRKHISTSVWLLVPMFNSIGTIALYSFLVYSFE